ncbi:MAG: hypothetical protein AAFU65_16660 [Pseudomonadota bacterium]
MQGCRPTDLPPGVFLERYDQPGMYTDCFRLDVPRAVDLCGFISAFYTTPLFKMERGLLKLGRLGATDEQARALARGELDRFAAWTVEDRDERQLLMCDVRGLTRSWLMCEPDAKGTALFFGSAVVPKASGDSERGELGLFFKLTLGAHKKYSVALLNAAGRALMKDAGAVQTP